MKIYFAGIPLSDWNDFPAIGVKVNGATVNDVADILKAAARKFYSRGNDAVTLTWRVDRKFSTTRDAQAFAFAGFFIGPKNGGAVIVCGPETPYVVAFVANAVLDQSNRDFGGIACDADYTMRGGAVGIDSGALVVLTPSSAGNIAIANAPVYITVDVAPAAGSYTYVVYLVAPSDPKAKRDFIIQMPAGGGVTIEIRNLTSGGTLLHTVNTASIRQNVRCSFDGTNWQRDSYRTLYSWE